MSEFQDHITDIVLRSVSRHPMIDLKKTTYQTERAVEWKTKKCLRGRQDLFVKFYYKLQNENPQNICFEIKSGVEDLRSGYGLNFCEDYNFLVFEAGHGYSAIRTKHWDDIPEYVGILCIINSEVVCMREARPRNSPKYIGMYFSIGFGKTPKEYLEQVINIA